MSQRPRLRWAVPPVYFLHIPKTAGTSLQALIRSAYAEAEVLPAYAENLHAIDPATLGRYRCFLSHLGPSLQDYLPHPTLVSVTMLRDPVERALSSFYFNRVNVLRRPDLFPAESLQEMRPLLKTDVRGWLDGRGQDVIGNLQTQVLGSQLDLRPFFKTGEIGRAGFIRHDLLWSAPNRSPARNLAALYERACLQLERMAVVGLTERFAESASLVCDLLGLPEPAQLPEDNIGPGKTRVRLHGYRDETPPDLVARISELNQYDIKLYAYARGLLESQLSRRRRVIYLARPIVKARRAWTRVRPTRRRWRRLYEKLRQHAGSR